MQKVVRYDCRARGWVSEPVCIIFLLEYLDNSFKRPDDIEEDLELPVLCSVPQIIDRKMLILRRFEYASCAIFSMISFVLFAGFAVLALKGVEPTLEFVRKIGIL